MTPFLEGEAVTLRPVERDDYVGLARGWLNDRVVTKFLSRGTFPMSAEDHEGAFETYQASPTDVEFAVVSRETSGLIGICGLHGIQWVPRHAEFRVLLGDRTSWGHGAGGEVLQLLCAYAFELLNLEKVWLGVNADNVRALTTYTGAGFTTEGTLRQEVYRNGRWHDAVRMSLLRQEYRNVVETWSLASQIRRQLGE